ncbi:MAG TPA: glycosyltransferase family A protein [Nitrospira sp.]|nr:glycosyltransferase family A protein [Nitrospira sp.]
MLVSFVIPHKGRNDLLRKTLLSISNQDIDLNSVQVIIVSQSPQFSADVLGICEGLDVKVHIRPESETISALRNFGVKHATGTYLAFLDADVEIAPDWTQKMIQVLNEGTNRALVSAIQRNGQHAPVLEKIRTALSNIATDCPVRFLPGRNLLVRRETFFEVGGFPEHLVTCEDYYFTDQVSRKGELYYSTRSSYVHLGEDKHFAEMFRKEIWRGQSNLQSISGRGVSLRELPSYLVPVWMLGFAIAATLAVISGEPKIALTAAAMGLLPVFVYSIRLSRFVGREIEMIQILKFYSVYFPARMIGTVLGVFRVIR